MRCSCKLADCNFLISEYVRCRKKFIGIRFNQEQPSVDLEKVGTYTVANGGFT